MRGYYNSSSNCECNERYEAFENHSRYDHDDYEPHNRRNYSTQCCDCERPDRRPSCPCEKPVCPCCQPKPSCPCQKPVCPCTQNYNNYCQSCCNPKCMPCSCCPTYPSIPGGYSQFRPLTSADLIVFQTATANLMGISYEPLSVRTQVVNGTNYTFIARATTTTLPTTSYYVLVNVTQASDGTITLGPITPLANPL